MAPPVEYKSRYNTIMQFTWATLGGLIATAASPLLGNGPLDTFLSGALVTLSANAGVAFFNHVFSRYSSTVDQDYQPAWIWPHPFGQNGYLILQPHHYRRHHHGRDRLDFHRTPRVLGYTDTLEQAQVICEHKTHAKGLVEDVAPRTDPRWALWHKGWREYQKHAPKIAQDTANLLTGIWQYAQVDATHAAVVAFRQRMTAQGWQWEFFPLPPQAEATPHALHQQMQAAKVWSANDDVLPEKLVDSHVLTDHTDVAAAWHFQALTHQSQHTVPWQFLNVAEPGTPPRWTLGCATPGKHATDPPVWHFWPESGPLVTWPDLETARQAINRVAAPHTDLSTWPINAQPDPTLITTWRHAVGLAAPSETLRTAATLSAARRATPS